MYVWMDHDQFSVVESSLAAWLAWQASRALIFKKQKPCTHVSHVRQGGNQNLAEIWPIARNGRETLGPWAGLRM